jgi:hypothetical protein
MKRTTLDQAIEKTNALHSAHPPVNGRTITLGRIWNVLGTRWTWCERFEPTGAAVAYRIEDKWLFEPVYQPSA